MLINSTYEKAGQDLLLAMEWVAAEYKYVLEVKKVIEHISGKQEIAKLQKLTILVQYLMEAEQRAEAALKYLNIDLQDFSREFADTLEYDFKTKQLFFKKIQEMRKELNVGAKWCISTTKVLNTIIGQEKTVADVERVANELGNKPSVMNTRMFTLVDKVKTCINDVSVWLEQLLASLRKAQDVMKSLPIAQKQMLHNVGKELFNLKTKTRFDLFLAAHPADTAVLLHYLKKDFNKVYFLLNTHEEVKRLMLSTNWFWPGLLSIVQSCINSAIEFEDLLNLAIETELTQEKWSALVTLAKSTGSSLQFLYMSHGEIPEFVRKTGLSEAQAIAFFVRIKNTRTMKYFDFQEALDFFVYCKTIHELLQKEKIDVMYALDRSGRILGFLVYVVLSRGGFEPRRKGIKLYYLHATRQQVVTFYAERQKKEIQGKNVLIIDEFVDEENTKEGVLREVNKYAKKAIFYPFRSSMCDEQDPLTGTGRILPSWYHTKSYSGVEEKIEGGVQIAKPEERAIAWNVRNALVELASIIAEFLNSI